jgi:hypothetical protein
MKKLNKKSQASSMLLVIGVFILVFWALFPFGMQLLNTSTTYGLSDSDLNTIKDTKNTNSITESANIYFKYLFLDIPEIPPTLRIIVVILQLLSLMFIIFAFFSVIHL